MGHKKLFIVFVALIAATTAGFNNKRVSWPRTVLNNGVEPPSPPAQQNGQSGGRILNSVKASTPVPNASGNVRPSPGAVIFPSDNRPSTANQGINNQPTNQNNGQNANNPQAQTQNNAQSRSDLLPTDCGRDLSSRIVGGNQTDLGEFPWMAVLEYSTPQGNKSACGGALINKRYVLTAAHCLVGIAKPRTWTLRSVILGEHNTATNPDCILNGNDGNHCADKTVTISIEKEIVHEGYQPRSRDQQNDIALLRLSRDVPFTTYIRPICLPRDENLGRGFVVAGWGRTETNPGSEVMLKVKVPLHDMNDCQKAYSAENVVFSSSQLCAGGEKDKDSCTGDSGGPLMQPDRDSSGTLKWTAVGVVSFGPKICGTENWPGVYTKVYSFRPWISNQLKP